MKTILMILLGLTLSIGLNNCKKDVPKTGSIKILFSGTPSSGNGETVTFNFAKDLYHLDQKIYSFSKVSTKPHVEMLINDIDPIDWYVLEEQSTGGMPWQTKSTLKVEAGKTSILTFTF